MKIIKINENNEKNQPQNLFQKLNMAFSNQTKDIQILVQPLLSQIVWLEKILDDTRARSKPYDLGSNGKMSEEVQAYTKLLKQYNEIIMQLIETLKK